MTEAPFFNCIYVLGQFLPQCSNLSPIISFVLLKDANISTSDKCEFEGKSFKTPVTVKSYFPSIVSVFPSGFSSLKYLEAIFSVIATEKGSDSTVSLLPCLRGKSNISKKEGSVKQILSLKKLSDCLTGLLPMEINLAAFSISGNSSLR